MKISIVSPVYMAEPIVPILVEKIGSAMARCGSVDHEIILVDDGSPDGSWEKIREICKSDPKVQGIRLSRNFGQHDAIRAGIEASTGDYVVVMDCDLQDNPKYIADLYAKASEGFPIVFTEKDAREHALAKDIPSRIFHRFFNLLSDSEKTDSSLGNYSIISRQVADTYCSLREAGIPYTMALKWLGFRHASIPVVHEQRPFGRSSYSFFKLLTHAVGGIIAFSDKALKFAVAVGFASFVVSLCAAVYLVGQYFLHGARPGWTSTIVLNLLTSSMIMIFLGILGTYLARTLELTRRRPIYIVQERLNFLAGRRGPNS